MRHIVFPYLSHKERDILFFMDLYHKGPDVQILSCVLDLISNLTQKSLFPLGRTFALIRMPRLILVNNVNINGIPEPRDQEEDPYIDVRTTSCRTLVK